MEHQRLSSFIIDLNYPSIRLLHPLRPLEPLQAVAGRRQGRTQHSLLPITFSGIYLSAMLYVCKLLRHAVKKMKKKKQI